MLQLFTNAGYNATWDSIQNRGENLIGSLAQYHVGQWIETPSGAAEARSDWPAADPNWFPERRDTRYHSSTMNETETATGDGDIAAERARWESTTLKKALDRGGERQPEFATTSTETRRLYTSLDTADDDYDRDIGVPGEYPYTRGVQPTMYRGRLWTMRQYAGFGTAKDSNERFKFLLSQGQTGLSVAFDLPTQIGMDSDDPNAEAEVGQVGVAIDSLADMEEMFAGIPLDRVSTSMTINAPAAVLVAMYMVVAEKQGVPSGDIMGTAQNDVLKEYVARGTYIYPPRASLRLAADLSPTARATRRSSTASASAATTSATPVRRPRRRSASPSRMPSPTSRLACARASASMMSRRASRGSSTRTTTSSKRSPSTARFGACGRACCASASVRRIRTPGSCARTSRQAARR